MADSNAPSSSTLSTSAHSFSYTEFTPVPTSRKRRREKLNHTTRSIHSLVTALCGRFKEEEWFIKCSSLLKEAWDRFSASAVGNTADESSKDHNRQVRVLCLGLGSPSTSKDARVQLAFLLEMCKGLNIPPNAISAYDPIFTTEDTTSLRQLNIKVLDQLETGAYVFSIPTLLFMPHCDLELYELILSVNLDNENLSRLFLVGNTLRFYLDNRPIVSLLSIAPCVLQFSTSPRFTDIPFPASWPTAFNNTSIQFLEVEVVKKPDAAMGAETSV